MPTWVVIFADEPALSVVVRDQRRVWDSVIRSQGNPADEQPVSPREASSTSGADAAESPQRVGESITR
jgi:hypothetical protein